MPDHPYILNDADVELAQRQGGRLVLGPWVVRLPRRFGFCGGVLKALRMIQETLEAHSGAGRILLLGDIIHNETINDRIRRQGVILLPEANDEQSLADIRQGVTVVMPAFGVPAALAATLQAWQTDGRIQLVDTTCGYVRRIWEFVENAAAGGATVLILGKPEHPENRATLSRALAPDNAVIQISHLAAARALAAGLAAWREGRPMSLQDQPGLTVHHPERLHPGKLAFAAQTTLLHSEVAEAEGWLRQAAAAAGAAFASAATVCPATRERQQAAEALCAEGCDLFLVIGGFNSSNTTQLHHLAAKHAPAYFIRSAAEFDADRICHYDPTSRTMKTTAAWLPPGPATLGLLSGASCPDSDVGGVIRKLRQLAAAAAARENLAP